MSPEEYELASRVVIALESIASSLIQIAARPVYFGMDRAQPGADQSYPSFGPIEGVDDLMGTGPGTDSPYLSDYDKAHGKPLEEPVDAAALAREAEDLLNEAATPDIRSSVHVGEEQAKIAKQMNKINLFKQDRDYSVMDLIEGYPDDAILKNFAVRLSEGRAKGEVVKIEGEAAVLAAAIEIVYSHLSHDMWGSESAVREIKNLVDFHSENV